ncbi:tRNA preQ1(34) S-adenosylmethionine ribosyltransferase-isomerase QueA [soil metagenome]
MEVADYDFELPPELIADRPLPERDASRMLVLHRESGRLEHRMFRDLPEYLRPGDLAVLNDSRVIKARLFTEDGRIEILLLEHLPNGHWKCLCKPGRKMKVGDAKAIAGTTVHVRDVLPEGERVIEFETEPDLDRYGAMPIPPYFKREADEQDAIRYQTVYAHAPGSVAAPTAGLHFTPEVLARIPHAFLTLHVGIGTFQPVKVDRIEDHRMHSETYSISPEAAAAINAAQRLLAVGTTSCRVLESQPPGAILPHSGSTDIFLHPPKTPQRVGALLTNFHLPKSTLIMLVAAFVGRERILEAYAEAIRERYRFFSYGDCMLVL